MSRLSTITAVAGTMALTSAVSADLLFTYVDPAGSGLSGEAQFSMTGPSELTIRYKNTSTGVPNGFSNSDQLLTGISWDFGPVGAAGITITGGTVFTGPSSLSLNFDILNVGANADVSGEFGFGNNDGTGALTNFVSSNTAQATPFGGVNLDGTVNIDGPQAGLVANPVLVPLGGLGAIQDEVIATLTLSAAYTEAQLLADLLANGTQIEFGSDAAFITGNKIPVPGTLALLAVAGVVGGRRRRR